MPKSDSWPGGVATKSLSNMDSAGSCESVISMNSGYSEDSMEHLSAEERACIMYLEETIEALEIQEDSGISNDEPDLGLQAGKMDQGKVNDTSSFMSKFGEVEHHTLSEISEPKSHPVSEPNTQDLLSPVNLVTQPKPLVTVNRPELCVTTDANGNPIIVTGNNLHPDKSSEASGMDPSLIPPPSDFMDEPHPLAHPKEVKRFPPSAGTKNNKSLTTVDLEQIRQRASGKKTSYSSSLTEESPSMPSPEVSPCPSPLAIPSDYLRSPPPESAEPRSPPAVAPKPKKLPANIQKSYRSPATASEGNGVTTSNDQVLLDPQRVHMEALRKLGLLKSDEAVSGPPLSPKFSLSPSQSPRTRRSWGAPPSPFSPAALQTPSNTYVNSPSPVFVPLQPLPATSPSVNPSAPDIFPVPAAFSDPSESLPVHGASAVKHVSKDNGDAEANMPHLNSPTLTKYLTPPKITGVKSATLERSGLELSSSTASQDFNMASQLRNSRPRPASLGSRKEFPSAQGENVQMGRATSKEHDPRRSLPAHRDSKLPRSEGISVLICPRSDNEEDRRKALKKLGLLRD
ncbi:hypothetical protein JOB18_000080 [Solea senegalensis]|uniref:Specifically androgen-regulated gene protein n=1 Tax=Solea senegalensis TaxID=28829 RepID=A0AAV6SNQ8_SOLSE|nr:specifically androgen-regulated gene protein-like [Solea senegalensis]KAG7519036.1 hypothetical protein JOB18_000080 [Solea senegalensis]